MRRYLLILGLAIVLGACGGGGDDSPSDTTYDEQGFDENGCNRGETFEDGLCQVGGECGDAGDALDAYMVENGPDGSSELTRLEQAYEQACE